MNTPSFHDNWSTLLRFLPDNWEQEAYTQKALMRRREIKSPEVLLRVLLIHLAEGLSLRSTSTWAAQAGLCKLNDSALFHRLKASQEWFRWLALRLREQLEFPDTPNQYLSNFRVRLVDASVISEPGSTGSDWRLHYSINLHNFYCDSFEITDCKVGERLERFSIQQDDLILADRTYCKRSGISHVFNNGGQVLIRFHSTSLPLETYRGSVFDVLHNVAKLDVGEIGDYDVYITDENDRRIKGRICAIKKSKEAAEKEIKRIKAAASRKGRQVKPETYEFAKYIIVFTTMNRHKLKKEEVLHLYRSRWQVELAFKRMKSILDLGHLPKKDPVACKAWLYGKMFVALLVERIHREADCFSPWGYPL